MKLRGSVVETNTQCESEGRERSHKRYVHNEMYNTSRAGQAGGVDVSMKKTISQRQKLPIECAQGDQPLRCPNRVF